MEPRGLSAIPLPCDVEHADHHHNRVPIYSPGPSFFPPFLQNLQLDDIILIVLIILLLSEGNQCDFVLVVILIVIFLSGIEGNVLGL